MQLPPQRRLIMKRSSKSLVLCLAAVVTVLASCGTAQPPAPAPADTRAQDEAAIRAAAQDWSKAIDGKNLDQTLSYYADDAWVYPQNASIAKTADQRRSVWTAFFATPGASDMEGDICLLYTSPSPRDGLLSRMPSSA